MRQPGSAVQGTACHDPFSGEIINSIISGACAHVSYSSRLSLSRAWMYLSSSVHRQVHLHPAVGDLLPGDIKCPEQKTEVFCLQIINMEWHKIQVE